MFKSKSTYRIMVVPTSTIIVIKSQSDDSSVG